MTLSAESGSAYGVNGVRLTWSGASWRGAWIVRNETLLAQTQNNGTYIDIIRGGGTYTYAVCAPNATDISMCSNFVTVTF